MSGLASTIGPVREGLYLDSEKITMSDVRNVLSDWLESEEYSNQALIVLVRDLMWRLYESIGNR